MSDLNRSPRSEVLEVLRVAGGGRVTWHHRLSCDHVEVRTRRSPRKMIACRSCWDAPKFEEISGPTWNESRQIDLSLKFASALGLDASSVNVVINADGDVVYASAIFSPDEVRRISQ